MLIDHVEVVEDVGLVGCPMQTCPPECSDVLTRTCPCDCTACQTPRKRIMDGTVVSALIEFEDGYRAVTSGNVLRRAL